MDSIAGISRLIGVGVIALITASCSNTGTLLVRNVAGAPVRDVEIDIQGDGGTQRLHTHELSPSGRIDFQYPIASEYYLTINVTDANGGSRRFYYGYVLDSGRNPVHEVIVEDGGVTVDGEKVT
jgi:hypothetical protein